MIICLDQRTGTGCGTVNKDGAQFCASCGRSLHFALQLRNPGDIVGVYRIAEVIGHGSFGAVYLADALQQPGQRVALKETFDPGEIQNYKAEFAVLARLQHSHLPSYHNVFEANGNGYLVMEYVPGQSLQEVLDRQQGPLLEAQVLGYAIQLCDALAFLHSQTPPILHRDIKPANVRLTPEGLIKLVDFGLVKEGGGATRSSRRGVTPSYAPPEQWGLGGQHTDARSDIYALSATLYHLLTGIEPPAATDRISVTPDSLVAPRSLNRGLSAGVSDAILQGMALPVQQRPADAAALRRLLWGGGRTGGYGAAAPVTPGPVVVSPPAPRHWGSRLAVVAVMALLLVLSFAFYSGLGRTALPVPMAQPSATPTGTVPLTHTPLAALVVTPTPTATAAPPTVAPDTATPTGTPPPTNTPLPGTMVRNSIDNVPLVYIPGGEFSMGITSEMLDYLLDICPECEKESFVTAMPQHKVYLDSFWIYQTEVTNSEYTLCVEVGACNLPTKPSSETRPNYYASRAYADYPVVNVDWESAQQYCEWANGRLPTEAEWERAARGNDDRLFPWGNNPPLPRLANVNQSIGDTSPVGSYPEGASPFGVLDMAGNVWEWVYDWYDPNYYRVSEYRNPAGPDSPSVGKRSGRGGSWYWGGTYASSVYHDWWEPDKSDTGVGFRCVLQHYTLE